ncbi:MAG: DEAD/DEAH box helicase [Candidatus Sericytochromatia bacterium]|nr:DEAD/DEAH box helicase [Candidatus Tanganyikabacteria bacterium]
MIESFREIVAKLPGYEARPGQEQMAALISEALDDGRHAIVEAGTGSGKSFAYLIPLLQAEGPFVVSTNSIPLQEQLISKDVPFLESALGQPIRVTLAKGRGHYLCRQKFWELDRTMGAEDPRRPAFDTIKSMLDSWDGDDASLPFEPESALWNEIGQSTEDCLNHRCEFFDLNPVRRIRHEMAGSHLIVTNHALYMADLAAGGGILPDHRAVVFDEAHHLPETATKTFSSQIGRFSQMMLLQKLRRRVAPVPDKVALGFIDLEARLFEWLLSMADGGPMPANPHAAQAEGRSSFRLYPDARFLDVAEGFHEQLVELRQWLSAAPEPLGLHPDLISKAPLHRERLRGQLDSLIARWEFFAREAGDAGDRVNWVELDRSRGYFELKSAPLGVGPILRDLLWLKRPAILTSATLAVDGDFQYFRNQLGLPEPLELALPSPFDYERQALLYIPRFLPEPNHPGFAEDSREAIRHILDYSQGRAFVLFTSHRAMRSAFRVLAPKLEYPCRQQGELPRAALLEWFKATPGAVLFATASFWEGVDVPGDALSCVIIDRLPFAVPDDPVIQARVERMKQQGRDWFREFTLPEAIIRLKQGFGRLIRTGTDRGLVAILDNRLLTKAYGATILKALPPCPRIRDLDEVV